MRKFPVISTVILMSFGFGSPSYADEFEQACSSLENCFDILKRHSATEFDYLTLSEDFAGFGDVAKGALMRMAAGTDPEMSERSLQILARIIRLTPGDQSELIKLYRSRPAPILANMLAGFKTPAARDTLIAALGNSDEAVRDAAKNALAYGISGQGLNRTTPIPAPLLPKLAEAMLVDPRLFPLYLGQTDPNRNTVLKKAVASDDRSVVSYGLYALNIVDTNLALGAIRHDDIDAGIVMGQLGLRPDFIDGIFKAPTAPRSHRVAALVAIAQGQTEPEKIALLSRYPGEAFAAFRDATSKLGYTQHRQDVIAGIFSALQKGKPSNLSGYYTLITSQADAFKTTELMLAAIDSAPSLSKQNTAAAMSDKRDWRVILAALERSKPPAVSKNILTNMARNHPISQVRVAASKALGSRANLDAINRQRGSCVAGVEAKGPRQTRPEFKPLYGQTGAYQTSYSHKRQTLLTDKGWLVSYDFGRTGGVLTFNSSPKDRGDAVLSGSISRVYAGDRIETPIRFETPFSNSRYWVVDMSDSFAGGYGKVYSLRKSRVGFDWREQAVLPGAAKSVKEMTNGDLFIDFLADRNAGGTVHPPLVLTLDGELRTACQEQPTSQRPPAP